ncbi:MAG: undecaprenyl-diphosphate phosphatase [Elusimicrobiota bacterium]|jgi:undecaprenyl-diphosphatase|nr:undecaprenyl-diphosphate phosphatase [Elusimicrobiota bacterium]
MTNLDAFIQGIIQGATEFLPISSSGHLAIFQHFFGINENNLIFDVALHIGTLLSVIIIYFKNIIKIIKSFFTFIGKLFSKQEMTDDEKILINLFVSLLPLFFLFLPLPGGTNIKDFATNLADAADISIVGLALIATSAMMFFGILFSGRCSDEKEMEKISPADSFCVGFAQFFASVFPGFSRSGSTLSFGLMRGIDRQAAVDFSFLMGIPAIIAAAVLEFKESENLGLQIEKSHMLIGIFTAAVSGFFSIKILKWILKNDKTWIFVIYTLCLGVFLVFWR